jgi:hypothetical protein
MAFEKLAGKWTRISRRFRKVTCGFAAALEELLNTVAGGSRNKMNIQKPFARGVYIHSRNINRTYRKYVKLLGSISPNFKSTDLVLKTKKVILKIV